MLSYNGVLITVVSYNSAFSPLYDSILLSYGLKPTLIDLLSYNGNFIRGITDCPKYDSFDFQYTAKTDGRMLSQIRINHNTRDRRRIDASKWPKFMNRFFSRKIASLTVKELFVHLYRTG